MVGVYIGELERNEAGLILKKITIQKRKRKKITLIIEKKKKKPNTFLMLNKSLDNA